MKSTIDYLNSDHRAGGNHLLKSGGFLALLRANRNYRFTWTGQIVSEVGDNFNNVAVFSLALANTDSGLVVAASCSRAPSPCSPPDPSPACCSTAWTAAAS